MIGSRPSMAGGHTGFVAAQQCDRGDDMFMRLVNEVLSLFDGEGLPGRPARRVTLAIANSVRIVLASSIASLPFICTPMSRMNNVGGYSDILGTIFKRAELAISPFVKATRAKHSFNV